MWINFVKKKFTQIWRLFFIDHRHIDIERFTSDTEAEQYHLYCWQQKLEQE